MMRIIRLNTLPVVVFAMISASPTTSTNMANSLTVISTDFIFGDDREFAQCHASTIVAISEKKFLVAWFGGTHEKHNDVGIWLSKGSPGKWSTPVEVAKIREEPHWNPVLFKAADGNIILFFKVGSTIAKWETWYVSSADEGTTWSTPRELVPGDKGGRGPVKNKPIILSDGTWLAPASDEQNGWNAFVDRSVDMGRTWERSAFVEFDRGDIAGEGIIQPALWESRPGRVHMLLRSSSGWICRSDSDDGGRSWSLAYRTSLPNPNSGIDLAKSPDGALVLAYNRAGNNWGSRNPLSLAYSVDDGKTWSSTDVVVGADGDEFSYPAIISMGDTVIVTYTWKRERIGFIMATLDQ